MMGVSGRGGPFAYCDYWASVLGFRSIVSRKAQDSGLIDLHLFRHALDRPPTRLVNWGIYALATLLGPGAILYQMATRVRRRVGSREHKRWQRTLTERLRPFQLDLERREEGRVYIKGLSGAWNGPLLDPARLRVVASTIFPTYKLLLATLITMAFLATAWPILTHLGPPFFSSATFTILAYAGLVGVLFLLFGDIWTALLGPVPVLVAREVLVFNGGIEDFYLRLLVVVVIVYFIEFFFLPRPLPPILYLYVNEPDHPLQTYEGKEAPHWLRGKAYWVWRFVILAPAEITKFWERDWERMEIWVRADEGPHCGEIEWFVSDQHYRELWFEPRRWLGDRYDELMKQLAEWRENSIGRRHWLLEVDMDLLFHSPSIRRLEWGLGPGPRSRSGPLRILKCLGVRSPADFPLQYWSRLKELELQGIVLLTDVPEHIRPASTWTLLRKPWSYWRYPLGVLTDTKQYIYNSGVDPPEEASCSSDFQIKSSLRRSAAADTNERLDSAKDVESAGDETPGTNGTA